MNTSFTTAQRPELHPAADARRPIRAGLLVLGLAVAAGIAWSCLAALSAAVIAPGVVKVEDNRKTVQHREGGIVGAILVTEGEHVSAGRALIQLGDERVQAELRTAAAQLDAETAKAARLLAQSVAAPAIEFPPALLARAADPQTAAAMQSQRSAFQARQRALDEQMAALDEQGIGLRQEIDSLQAQIRSRQAATSLMREEVRTHAELNEIGFVSKMQVLRLQRGLEDYESQRHEHLSNTARARQRLADLASRRIALRSDYRQAATDELPQAQARIATLEQQLGAARDAARRQEIVAPVTGQVVGLKVYTVGGVVAPGAPLLDIVPDQKPLLVEARLDVDDVVHASVGARAQVRLSAYSARSAPVLEGRLRQVSADRIVDAASGRPYYLAQIDIDAQSLRDAAHVHLQPGMAAEVFLLAGERSLWQYLLEPIRNSMRRALRQTA
jgi:membrane fusion protein, epimerase transport system